MNARAALLFLVAASLSCGDETRPIAPIRDLPFCGPAPPGLSLDMKSPCDEESDTRICFLISEDRTSYKDWVSFGLSSTLTESKAVIERVKADLSGVELQIAEHLEWPLLGRLSRSFIETRLNDRELVKLLAVLDRPIDYERLVRGLIADYAEALKLKSDCFHIDIEERLQ